MAHFWSIILTIFLILICHSSKATENSELDAATLRFWQLERAELLNKIQEAQNQLFSSVGKIAGIELIIADPLDNRPESKFGHSFLRFVSLEPQSATEDYVLSFAADVDEPILSYKKGALGGYKVMAQVDQFGNFIKTYLEKERRPLSRYIIPTTENQRKNILLTLKKWVLDKQNALTYKFATTNCSGALVTLLAEAGVPILQPIAPVPTLLSGQLKRQYLNPYPAPYFFWCFVYFTVFGKSIEGFRR